MKKLIGHEVEAIRQYYLSHDGDDFHRSEIAKVLNLHPETVSAIAGRLGVSNRKRSWNWGSRNPRWRGDAVKNDAAWDRAQRRYSLGKCERCEKPAQDRHHIDGNIRNNDTSNIARLCRRHHMEVDGRLAKLIQRNRERLS